MNLPPPAAERSRSSRVSTSALVVMIIIVGAMALVAIFANVQRFRDSHVETVVVRLATPSPSPAP